MDDKHHEISAKHRSNTILGKKQCDQKKTHQVAMPNTGFTYMLLTEFELLH